MVRSLKILYMYLHCPSTHAYVHVYICIDEGRIIEDSGDKKIPVFNSFMSQLFSLMDGSIDSNCEPNLTPG